MNYIKTNFTDYKIVKIERDKRKYEVELLQANNFDISLEFDKQFQPDRYRLRCTPVERCMPDRLQRFTMTGRQKSTDVHCTTKYDRCPGLGGRSFFVRMAEFPLAKIIKPPSADTYSPVRHKVHLKVPSASYRKYSNWNPSKHRNTQQQIPKSQQAVPAPPTRPHNKSSSPML